MEAQTVGLKGIRKFGGGCWRASITSLESPSNNTKIQKENWWWNANLRAKSAAWTSPIKESEGGNKDD